MALTATASKGFEPYRYVQENEVLYIPGDPGDTYTQGLNVVGTVGEGIVDVLADNEGGNVGIVDKTTVCPASTTAMPLPSLDVATDSRAACLIPIRPSVPAGTPVYKVTFANQYDCTIASWTAGTLSMVLAASPGGNDYYNGAIVYVYEGTGAGQVNVIADYDHASVTAIMHRDFLIALDATSKVIVLAGEAVASRGVGFFNRCEAKAAGTVTTDQGSDDGDFVVYMDFRNCDQLLKNLMLTVIPARYMNLA